MIRSSNPALSDKAFRGASAHTSGGAMTIQGTVNKTLILFGLLLFTASWAWANPAKSMPLIFPALILGFIVALVTVFNKQWSMISAPVYALVEGVVLGAISSYYETRFPGIVNQAVALTLGVLFSLLAVYKSGIIKVTNNFRLGIMAATGGIALLYIVSMVMGFFGASIPFIHNSGPLGIGFSLFVVVIASLNLVLDFDFIERASRQNMPKYMEWYGAFGLIVTLVWLYLEILRLLSKLNRR